MASYGKIKYGRNARDMYHSFSTKLAPNVAEFDVPRHWFTLELFSNDEPISEIKKKFWSSSSPKCSDTFSTDMEGMCEKEKGLHSSWNLNIYHTIFPRFKDKYCFSLVFRVGEKCYFSKSLSDNLSRRLIVQTREHHSGFDTEDKIERRRWDKCAQRQLQSSVSFPLCIVIVR